jgi:hypothetical protein
MASAINQRRKRVLEGFCAAGMGKFNFAWCHLGTVKPDNLLCCTGHASQSEEPGSWRGKCSPYAAIAMATRRDWAVFAAPKGQIRSLGQDRLPDACGREAPGPDYFGFVTNFMRVSDENASDSP